MIFNCRCNPLSMRFMHFFSLVLVPYSELRSGMPFLLKIEFSSVQIVCKYRKCDTEKGRLDGSVCECKK